MRWFRREIALRVTQRLGIEVGIACGTVAGLFISTGTDATPTMVTIVLTAPIYLVVRVILSLAVNPVSSSYLIRCPRPSGALTPALPTNSGSATDLELRAAGFLPRDAFNEWGGATTNLYDDGSCRQVLTTDGDDVIILTTLSDQRLCLTTSNMIPPHERLVVNHLRGDVGTLLAGHRELLDELAETQIREIGIDEQSLVDLLVIEWEIWDQIGPLFGPFVDIGHRRQPSLLRVRVPAAEIRARAMTTASPTTASPLVRTPDTTPVQPSPAETLLLETPEPVPVPFVPVAPTPTRGLAFLAQQARLAGERTDRAVAAGEHRAPTQPSAEHGTGTSLDRVA